MPSTTSPLSLTTNFQPLTTVELDAEWAQIQAVFNAGIRPSAQRLMDFAAAAGASPLASRRREDVLGLIADLLRRDEGSENIRPADPVLKNLLVILESGR